MRDNNHIRMRKPLVTVVKIIPLSVILELCSHASIHVNAHLTTQLIHVRRSSKKLICRTVILINGQILTH